MGKIEQDVARVLDAVIGGIRNSFNSKSIKQHSINPIYCG